MIEDHFDIPQVTPGRAQVAFTQMKGNAAVAGSALLMRRIDRAAASAKAYGDLLADWIRKLAQPSDGEALGWDRVTDKVVTSIQSQARARQRVEVAGSDAAKSIDGFLKRVLPRGAGGITRLPWPDAIEAEERLLGQLQGAEAGMVQTLELGGLVQRLAEVLPKFKAAVEKLPSVDVAFEQVRKARQEAHMRLCLVVATVYSEFGEDGQEALAEAAMAPIDAQVAAMQALRAAGRPMTDLDVVSHGEVPLSPALVPSED